MKESLAYIVIIDDDDDDLEILSSSMVKKGISCKCFSSGEKALFYLQLIEDLTTKPELIILDYNMPRLNGLQVLLKLKGNPLTMGIPVVIYSTTISAQMEKKFLAMGVILCLIKANTYSVLKAQIEIITKLIFSLPKSLGKGS